MLAKQIEIGKHYKATVNGKLQTVRVDDIEETQTYGNFTRTTHRVYRVTNIATNRKLSFRSAAKFKREESYSAIFGEVDRFKHIS